MDHHLKISVFLFLLVSLICVSSAKQKPINVALSGKWKRTPLLLETSEFFAKESNDLFWRFVDHTADQGLDYFELASDEVKYAFVQKYATEVLSPLQLSFLKFSLSLRAFSPAIQMFQQLSEQISVTENCSSFIEVNGEYSCDANGLSELLTTSLSRPPTPIYKFDHIYPGKSGRKTTVVILYTELGTNMFKEFHHALAILAKKGEITYCIRHFIKDVSDKPVRLSGYGVELAIKSTEYKAKDDTKVEGQVPGDAGEDDDEGEEVNGMVFSKLRELHPELKNELKEFRNHLMDSATELMPFKVWQLQDLGFQAGQKIMSVSPSDSLQYLRDISQNFPIQARSLVRTSVTSEFRREVKRNQQAFERMSLGSGSSSFYLNGLTIDLEVYDVFTLLDVMTSEASLVEGLHSLGFKGDKLQKLLQLDLKEGSDQSYAVDMRHTAVQYLNNLSSDKVYRNWPSSVQDLLRPTFPGMLRHIAKNLFHLVFIVDPAHAESKGLLKMAEAFLVHKAPLRLGLVFVCESESKSANGLTSPSIALTRAYTFIMMDQGAPAGLSFITDVFEKIGSNELTSDAIIAEFARQYPGEDRDMVFGDNDDYDDVRKAGLDFVSRIGLSGLPHVLINGVPLDKEQVKMDNFEEGVVMEVLKQTQIIQTAVYKGEVSDNTDILDWWMERDNVLPRLNSRILAPATKRLDLTGSIGDDVHLTASTATHLDSKSLTAGVAGKIKYITRKEEESLRPVTMWVVADLETVEGRDLMYSAIRHMKTSNAVRLGVIYNPVDTFSDKNFINKAVHVAVQTLSIPLAKILITKLVKEENVEELKAGTKTLRDLEVHGMDIDAYMKAFEAESDAFLKIHQSFAARVVGLSHGDRAVITNGAILGPLGKDEEMTVEDFGLLEKVASAQGAAKVQEALVNMPGAADKQKNSDTVMKVSCLLLSKGKQEKRHKVDFESDIHSVVKIEADAKIPAFTVEAIVNPVSREAQKLSSILLVLKQIANVDIRIYLNPPDKLSEMPLKSFYRYVLEPEVTFTSEGMMNDGPSAKFLDMPQKSLLTLNMDTPESWMVEAVTSPYDLDNILLEEVERSVVADFELEYLLLEGHCHDATTMQPPRGLQFVLGTNSTVPLVDTIVMANLGYFQLKANPGLWQLGLRHGRSSEIYNIESHEFTDTPDKLPDVIIAINSFKSKTIRIKVSKKPEKTGESLLQDDNDSGGLWDSISNTFTGSTKTEEDKDSTLNIFSVASGHLYERFLRIMMLSVLKNTQSKVKFWFLKNFLSPSFKDFIPYMAQEYGFEYELVHYKWPHWLNQQKEKQRIIWGYKILFLDVLFPLDVKKIIFVDADQIVRADLQELHDLDLNGAPYGYTPFCDSRKEMDGFRFWNSGYWKSHLAGRKYHISALYVIDLKRFRRIAAGDRLRGQYQGLSHDPNSLANLDQDLPNNMIHQVAIKSLPQEWLYCETWCSEDTKPRAKTIDLCNNPLTKEPKLQAAMRIVPEWKNFDYEVKVLWDEIYDTNTKSQIEYDPPDITSESVKSKVKEEL